jgi:hypothetical protein
MKPGDPEPRPQSPDDANDAGIRDVTVLGDKGNAEIERGGDDQPVVGVAMRQGQACVSRAARKLTDTSLAGGWGQ